MNIKTQKKFQCDILNLEWASSGRDREVATPICHTLARMGYITVEATVFNYRYYILKYRPKLLYVGDPRGAFNNSQAVKSAQKLGIPVICYTAEGNYQVGIFDEQIFYSHISNHNCFPDQYFLWSTRTQEMVQNLNIPIEKQIAVCGGVGFDRYKIYKFRSKQNWLDEYGKDKKKMVGYASGGFPALFDPKVSYEIEKRIGREMINRLRNAAAKISQILKQLIEQNSDTLFLLKEHPGIGDRTKSELSGLEDYPNIAYVWNEEPIADCINGCDIWMAFESTTCMEVWLLDKPTLFINPNGSDFPRTNIYKGLPIMSSYEQIQQSIDSFYLTGTLSGFAEKEEARRQVIQEVMQWDDGKNHLRAAYLIDQFMRSLPEQQSKTTLWDRICSYAQNFLYHTGPLFPKLPKFRTYAAARQRFNHDELTRIQNKYAPYLEKFNRENPLTSSDIAELNDINGLMN